MSRISARSASPAAALVGLALGLFASTLAAPTAAYAATPDLGAALTPSAVTGAAGDTVYVIADLINVDPVTDSGPAALALSLSGSTLLSLDAPGGTCDVATAKCTFSDGVLASDRYRASALLTLGTSGSVRATVVQSGGDANPANDTVSIPVTVSQSPPTIGVNPVPTPGLTPAPPPKPASPGPAQLTLTATPHPVRAGGALRLAVSLADSADQPLVAQPVTILRQSAGAAGFASVTEVSTDGNGLATWTDHPVETATYQARYAAPPGGSLGSAESLLVPVRVSFAVTTAISPAVVPPGGTSLLSVLVGSGAAGTPVTVQQKFGTGAWRSIGHPLLMAGGVRVLRLTRLLKVGTYSIRVIRGADATHTQGAAQARVTVTTTGRGDAATWTPKIGTKTSPGRWNPCAPILYYINPRHLPPTGRSDLQEALRRITLASGLTFRYGGRLDVVPTPGYLGPAGGILIAWATAAETRRLLPPTADGLGNIGQVIGRRIESGYLVLSANSGRPGAKPAGFGAGSPQGLVMMRELGHVVGLGRVKDRWSIMGPGTALPAAVWGAGDLAGLRALGRPAGCLA